MRPELRLSDIIAPECIDQTQPHRALATRAWYEFELFKGVFDSLLTLPPYATPAIHVEANITETLRLFEAIYIRPEEAPRLVPHIISQMVESHEAVLGEKYTGVIRSFDHVDQLTAGLAKEAHGLIPSFASLSIDHLMMNLKDAQKFAAAANVLPSRLFLTHDLYFQYLGQTTDPVAYTEHIFDQTEGFPTINLQKKILELLPDLVTVPSNLHSLPRYAWIEGIYHLDKLPAFRFTVEESFAQWKRALCEIVRFNIAAIWGERSISSLPYYLQRKLSEGRA